MGGFEAGAGGKSRLLIRGKPERIYERKSTQNLNQNVCKNTRMLNLRSWGLMFEPESEFEFEFEFEFGGWGPRDWVCILYRRIDYRIPSVDFQLLKWTLDAFE
jgi:hypothetical protein